MCKSKERWLHRCRRAERSYSRFKVRRGSHEEITLVKVRSSREEIPHVQAAAATQAQEG